MLADPFHAPASRSQDDSTIFRTANEAMQYAYSHRGLSRYADTNIPEAEAKYDPRRTNPKRQREMDDNEPSTDSELELSDPEEAEALAALPKAREVKPLKRRGFGVTQSLPAGSLRFGMAEQGAQQTDQEPEEWQGMDFSDCFNKPPE